MLQHNKEIGLQHSTWFLDGRQSKLVIMLLMIFCKSILTMHAIANTCVHQLANEFMYLQITFSCLKVFIYTCRLFYTNYENVH